jgi:lipoprotein signal peptidase
VFNIADCAVVVGCILAIVFVVFDKKASSMLKEKSESDGENSNEQ